MQAFLPNIHIDPTLELLKAHLEGLKGHVRVVILVDSNTAQHCLPKLNALVPLSVKYSAITIPAGETNKNTDQLYHILQKLVELECDRDTLLINLGGGMICDIGGFAASIFKRGIQYIHIPTTLLAQIDASIGGKNGIDFLGYKNLIGSITSGEQVFISSSFLKTLPENEMKSGVAEAFKHGLIADSAYWNAIKKDPFANMDLLLEGSISIKTSIVSEDPYEKGNRKKLNAGHTIGHAIESWKLNTDHPILHGEAVAAGLIMESYISKQLGLLSNAEFGEIENTLLSFYGTIHLDGYEEQDILSRMRQDKKNQQGKISFSLIRSIGEASINDTCDEKMITDALAYYLKK